MLPQTERYLDLARPGRNAWWRYVLGAVTIVFFWVLGQLPYFLLVGAGAEPGALMAFVAVNFSIFMMLAGLAVTVGFLHRRPLLSLVSPDRRIDWRRMARGAGAWLVIAAAVTVLEHLLYPGRYYLSWAPGPFFAFLAAVLVLTPIQCAVEELVFRGYALQAFGLLTRQPLAIAAASSLVFTLPHLLNPEVHQHGVLLMAANYFAIGMVLAMVTLRDGRLELAIGLHAANNVFLALIANYEGSALRTESVFTATVLDPVYSLAALVAGGFFFHAWIFGRNPA
ncbi:MAG TPA: type II CAAX endopeptidase family protein [Burkholderiales bacterium]|nr:type II CAAX endopeptidase family protein [Burkholderiales bacterium]